MTTGAQRASLLSSALHAALVGDSGTLGRLCTDDLRIWTPGFSASSLTAALVELERRDEAFTGFALETFPLEVGGDLACVEWTVSMEHTGPLRVAGGAVVEPTGLRVTVTGATVAEFRGPQICAVRQYWDELTVFQQLGLLPETDGGGSP